MAMHRWRWCLVVSILAWAGMVAIAEETDFPNVTKVSLSLKEVTPQEAYEALGKAAGVEIDASSLSQGMLKDVKITVELEDIPFWEAFARLCEQAPVAVNTLGVNRLRVRATHGRETDLSQLRRVGGLWVLPVSCTMSASRTLSFGPDIGAANSGEPNLSLMVVFMPDPGLRPASAGVQIESLTTETGLEVRPPEGVYVGLYPGTCYQTTNISLPIVPAEARTISLKGSYLCRLAKPSDRDYRLSPLEKGPVLQLADYSMEIAQVTRRRLADDREQLHLACQFEGLGSTSPIDLCRMELPRLETVSGKEVPMRIVGGGPQGVFLMVDLPTGDEPMALRWRAPHLPAEVRTPFELKDIPLPDLSVLDLPRAGLDGPPVMADHPLEELPAAPTVTIKSQGEPLTKVLAQLAEQLPFPLEPDRGSHWEPLFGERSPVDADFAQVSFWEALDRLGVRAQNSGDGRVTVSATQAVSADEVTAAFVAYRGPIRLSVDRFKLSGYGTRTINTGAGNSSCSLSLHTRCDSSPDLPVVRQDVLPDEVTIDGKNQVSRASQRNYRPAGQTGGLLTMIDLQLHQAYRADKVDRLRFFYVVTVASKTQEVVLSKQGENVIPTEGLSFCLEALTARDVTVRLVISGDGASILPRDLWDSDLIRVYSASGKLLPVSANSKDAERFRFRVTGNDAPAKVVILWPLETATYGGYVEFTDIPLPPPFAMGDE